MLLMKEKESVLRNEYIATLPRGKSKFSM
ncbi:Uncharacterized protein BCINRASA_02249 [Bacillus wiedmannii]|nr:Uncharacterized protein BCINRASA_02249 [Bacillus wiedmannii]